MLKNLHEIASRRKTGLKINANRNLKLIRKVNKLKCLDEWIEPDELYGKVNENKTRITELAYRISQYICNKNCILIRTKIRQYNTEIRPEVL